jgi:hypothetical protein
MNFRKSDIALAYLTLLCGLTISVVAIWYSVAGLVAIFAAAAIPIIIMGTVLETSKLVATLWLKWNWKRAPLLIKTYLLVAIFILMMITSMGIFGFLSKAHLDQAVPTGDIAAKVALIDEKIKSERDTIDTARKALAQLDAQVDQVLGRTEDARGAERAVQIRRNQARERTALQAEIAKSQTAIAKLNEEKAPIAKDLRAVEAEVGPIKYIAALIYGDNPDANLLEKAVRWVIIIIVLVFDPLAVVMLLASQTSFQWFRQDREKKLEEEQAEGDSPRGTTDVVDTEPPTVTVQPEPWPFMTSEPKEKIEPTISGDITSPERFGLVKEETKAEEVVEQVVEEIVDPVIDDITTDEELLNEADYAEKAAMHRWKEENPNDSLKHQRRLFELKLIDRLPWHNYLEAKPDYVQNEEQNTSTIWQRLKNIKK